MPFHVFLFPPFLIHILYNQRRIHFPFYIHFIALPCFLFSSTSSILPLIFFLFYFLPFFTCLRFSFYRLFRFINLLSFSPLNISSFLIIHSPSLHIFLSFSNFYVFLSFSFFLLLQILFLYLPMHVIFPH